MREILFRAKRVDNGEWVEGHYTKLKWCNNIIHVAIPDEAEIDSGNTLYESYEINPETLCQYTGMVDKNGNRIWENDIVKYMWFGNEEVDIVEYRSTSIGLKENYNAALTDITEVIGNVFDDKHLLDKTDYRREQEKEAEV